MFFFQFYFWSLPTDPRSAMVPRENRAGNKNCVETARRVATLAVELDVDLDNRFIWFDTGELEELPEDLPDAAPTAEQNADPQRITAEFSASVDDALAARDDGEVSERIYNRLAQRPGALRALDRVGRALTSY